MNAWFKDLDGNIVGVISAGRGRAAARAGSEITAMIAAEDLERAKRWYAEKLGFQPDFQFRGRPRDVQVGHRRGSPSTRPSSPGRRRTRSASGGSKGIRDEVARLRGRGVVFEDYDFGDGDKTVDGILSDAEGDAERLVQGFRGQHPGDRRGPRRGDRNASL